MTTEPEPKAIMPPAAFRTLRELRKHNDRDWMNAHGERVHAQVVAPFTRILVQATERLTDAGIELRGGPETVLRMRRDPRFAPDEAPFRPWVEGVLSPDGQRIGNRAAIHLRCALDGGFLRAGSFLLPPSGTPAVREAMVARRERFLDLARRLGENDCALVSDRTLLRGPRGFEAERGTPLGTYLCMRSPLAEVRLTQKSWQDAALIDRIVEFAGATRPWLLFLTEALVAVPDGPVRPPRSKSTGTAL